MLGITGAGSLMRDVRHSAVLNNMGDPSELCEVCHQSPATNFVCEPHLQRTRKLCTACFTAEKSPEMEAWDRRYKEVLKTAKCRFCGGQAVAGCGGSLPIVGEHYQFWCEECRKDLAEYSKTRKTLIEESAPEFSATEAGVERMSAWAGEQMRKLEEYMRAKIRERGQQQ